MTPLLLHWCVLQAVCSCNACRADLSRRLLRPGGIEHPHHALDNLWPAYSDSLVELSIVIHATDATRCIAAVNQLKSLTSLDVSVHPRSYRGDELADEIFFSDIEPSSHVLDFPGLKSLSLTSLRVKDVTLVCPSLRSLTVTRCSINGRLSLQAPLEHLCCTGCTTLGIHEAFPVSNLLGLTCLQCDVSCWLSQDDLYSILPRMSKLRVLDLAFRKSGVPWHLPASVQTIEYYLTRSGERRSQWNSEDFRYILQACQLPELQSITLVNWYKFNSDNMAALKHITEEVGGKVSVKAEMMGEDFMKPWNADMDESFCRSFL